MNLQEFNELDESAAMEKLLFCCGCVTWASILNTGRPYNDFEELVDVADSEWWKLSQEDWKEAFAAHPKYVIVSLDLYFYVIQLYRIGDKETLRQVHYPQNTQLCQSWCRNFQIQREVVGKVTNRAG